MSFLDGTAMLVTIDLRSRIDSREIDQFKACDDRIQATQSHQGADGGLTFAKSEQLSAEFSESVLCLSQVSRGLVISADLRGTDRQLSRSRQLHVSEGKHALKRAVSKAQDRLYRSADQFNGYPTQKQDSRNRNQVDIPLHVAPQSGRWFKLGFVFGSSLPLAPSPINQP
jgi:hypothetical protein